MIILLIKTTSKCQQYCFRLDPYLALVEYIDVDMKLLSRLRQFVGQWNRLH